MATRSAALVVAQFGAAGSPHLAATVPTNEVWIIKNVRINNASGGPGAAAIEVLRFTLGVAAMLAQTSDPFTDFSQDLWLVAEAGDSIYAASLGPVANFWVSGARLV